MTKRIVKPITVDQPVEWEPYLTRSFERVLGIKL